MKADSKRTCFVISPIGNKGSDIRKRADLVLNAIVLAALPDYEVKRADQLGEPAMITDKIIEAILESDLAIADLTGLNANVFYELGLRHAADKPVIHIAHEGTVLPFDNAGVSTVFFDTSDWHSIQEAVKALAQFAVVTQQAGYRPSNPLTRAKGIQNLSLSGDSRDQILAELSNRVGQLETFRNTLQEMASRSLAGRSTQATLSGADLRHNRTEMLLHQLEERIKEIDALPRSEQ